MTRLHSLLPIGLALVVALTVTPTEFSSPMPASRIKVCVSGAPKGSEVSVWIPVRGSVEHHDSVTLVGKGAGTEHLCLLLPKDAKPIDLAPGEYVVASTWQAKGAEPRQGPLTKLTVKPKP